MIQEAQTINSVVMPYYHKPQNYYGKHIMHSGTFLLVITIGMCKQHNYINFLGNFGLNMSLPLLCLLIDKVR